jgi:hypothetical protein
MKIYFPKTLKYKSIDNILNACKAKMKVDILSKKESEKQSFYCEKPPKFDRQTKLDMKNNLMNKLLIKLNPLANSIT